MSKFRRRYTFIDHENAMMHEVGLHYVLNPANNPADYAAMVTLADNSEPEIAQDLRNHLAMIDKFPDRGIGSQGIANLPFIKHPAIVEFAKRRLELIKAKVAKRGT